jgi:hypothetical protein
MKPSRVGFVIVVLLSVVQLVGAEEPTVRMQDIDRIIRESEYHVTWQDQTVLPDLEAAWQAPNRAQNLRFYFTEDGLRVVDRTAESSPELLQVRVVGIPPIDGAPATFEPAENGLGIHRGTFSEEFTNSANGLQHLLIINEPPPADGSLVIELEWSAAGMSVSPRAVEFRAESGRRLVYSLGDAFDAAGTSVEVALLSHGNRLLLTFSAPIVAYPVTIKNLVTGTANTVLEGNVADMGFGGRVASGDLNGDGFADLVAGAAGWDGGQVNEGAVMVFHGGPGGILSNDIGPLAPNAVIESNVPGFYWPTSLGVVGDVDGDGFDDIAAGATWWDPVNPPATTRLFGAVWVFEGSASGITSINLDDADTTIVSNVAGAAFGVSVSSAGDVNGDGFSDLIAGAWMWSDDPLQPSEGAAFVFHGSTSGIVATSITDAQATIEGNEANLYSGTTIADLGDVNGDGFDDVAVSIFGLTQPEPLEGGIAILHGGSSGIAGNPTEALASAADSLIEGNMANIGPLEFAGAGDVNGDGYADMIVGSPPWEDSAPHSDEGVVVIYHGSASGIQSNQTEPFTDAAYTVIEGNPNPHLNIQLGDRVMTAGDVNGDGYADIAAGANRYENGELSEGALFVFYGGPGGVPNSRTDPVEEVADIVIEGDMAGLFLGGNRPAAGDVNGDGYSDLLVPAPRYSSTQAGEGAVFIYHGAAEMLAEEPDGQFDAQQLGSSLGWTCASAGDVNGDGRADLVAGAPWYDIGGQFVGRVRVFHGSSGPFLSSPDWIAEGSSASDRIGFWQASAGDVNGDGFGDLVVGVPNHSNGQSNEGRVDVYHGSGSGLPSEPDWTFESDLVDAEFGGQVASAGDVNGDGYGDLIVGAPGYTNGESYEGRAYLFFGSSHGLSETPGWTFESDFVNAGLGGAVAGAGDVNGDGFADIIVGAPGYANGNYEEGAAYGFWGSAAGLPDVPNWFIETNRDHSGYGSSVAAIGDVNGDGYGDAIVGAPRDSNPESSEGRAYIYHGSSSGLSTIADRVLERNQASSAFGWAVAGAGDVNGDGFPDVVVGAPDYPSGALQLGRAELFLGSSVGVGAQPAWSIVGPAGPAGVGFSVANLGDHNGDGFSDVAVGIPASSSGLLYSGSVELYLGNAGAGRPVLARQMRGGDDPAPVQPWGLTHSGDAFNVAMTATSPRGRELVKLHVEACPPGETFGDVDCRHAVSEDWTAIPLGENGVVLTEALAGLTEGELYRWRAHVLYVPLHADEPGITTPPVPRHGPWRTLFAQRPAADIRVGVPQQITLELVSSSSSVSEGAVQAEVNAVVTTSDGEPTEVNCEADFETFNGTAFAGADFVSTSGNTFFYAGTASGTAQILPIGLTDDALDEPDENFLVEISNPTGAALGPQTVHTVTILDDDLPPELSAVDIGVDEGAGPAVVQLELSAPSSFGVIVNYGTVDGTAVAPFDFTHVGGTALIPAMDTVFDVEVPIEDDWLEEGEESFTLDLWSPSNAALVTSAVTVTIFDNDAGFIFADGFEIGATTEWSRTVP